MATVADVSGVGDALPPVVRRRRTVWSVGMRWTRRLHLYFGLFLLPWAVLYGVTAFLFNHPSVAADQPVVTFGRAELAGTAMATPPTAAETAQQVVEALQARSTTASTYVLLEPEQAKYVREFATATVKLEGRNLNVLLGVQGEGGTLRSRAETVAPPTERAPFAIGAGPQRQGRGSPPTAGRSRGAPEDGLQLSHPLVERIKETLPTVLERIGQPTGDVTVTNVPDLTFLMGDQEKTWRVTYNALTGSVSGRLAGEDTRESMSVRQFLLRLHVSHGYPYATNARWFWAVLVDCMAVVMVFWGVSGLLMWWQLKATRLWGALVLAASAVAATALGLGMHSMLTA